MSRGVGRAALIGTIMAFVVAIGVIAVLLSGKAPGLLQEPVPERLLVIVSAPDGEGVTVATYGFVLDPALTRPMIIDMRKQGAIKESSAQTPRTALPFGGGDVVAQAVASQTGGETLDWVVIKPDAWRRMVDQHDGVTATVPKSLSAYREGRLVVLDAGRRKLTGEEAEGLSAAIDFMGEEQADSVVRELSDAYAAIINDDPGALDRLMEQDGATTSLSPKQLHSFIATR